MKQFLGCELVRDLGLAGDRLNHLQLNHVNRLTRSGRLSLTGDVNGH